MQTSLFPLSQRHEVSSASLAKENRLASETTLTTMEAVDTNPTPTTGRKQKFGSSHGFIERSAYSFRAPSLKTCAFPNCVYSRTPPRS